MRGGGQTESEPNLGKTTEKSLSTVAEPLHYDTKKSENTRITFKTSGTKNLKSFLTKNAFWGLTRTYGFTLAEVLITLGIIGIVAVMTLPTLIQKNKKKRS